MVAYIEGSEKVGDITDKKDIFLTKITNDFACNKSLKTRRFFKFLPKMALKSFTHIKYW